MFYFVYGFLDLGALVILDVADFNIILGMTWFLPYHAVLNCNTRRYGKGCTSLKHLRLYPVLGLVNW